MNGKHFPIAIVDDQVVAVGEKAKASYTAQDEYAPSFSTPEDTVQSQVQEAYDLLKWFEHYITDKQYEKIPPEKDFELRDVLKRVRGL